jgi:trimeric autotransporter adhesin
VDRANVTLTEQASGGNDTVETSLATYTLVANIENLIYTGTGNFTGVGNTQNNAIFGGDGKDTLNGGTGKDTLSGGQGDDAYVLSSNEGDVIVEKAGQGTDTVMAGYDYVLGDNLENLKLTGAALQGTGNDADNVLDGTAAANTLYGLGGNDTLDGGSGKDTLYGGLGDDTYILSSNDGDVVMEYGDEGTDTVVSSYNYTLGANVENLTLTSAATAGTGNGLNNVLDAGAGSAASVTLTGLGGDDTYIVDRANVTLTEQASGGNDTVETSLATYTLVANIENLIYTGTGNFTGVGNTQDNTFTVADMLLANFTILDGGDGNDTFIVSGGAGSVLSGGSGDDVYMLEDGASVTTRIIENANGGGIDTEMSDAALILATNVENGVVLSSRYSGTRTVQGNDLNNIIDLGSESGTGGLTVTLTSGNDTYIANRNDGIIFNDLGSTPLGVSRLESSLETVDISATTLSYTSDGESTGFAVRSKANFNITLTRQGDANAVGNNFSNSISGNDWNNVLSGGAGADALYGYGGDDVLDGGTGYTAPAYEGGGEYGDSMFGGSGNDIYIVDSAYDVVNESAALIISPGSGIDEVRASINYSLVQSAHVFGDIENLTLTGKANLTGTGNALNNIITGNDGNNLLDGGAGNDTLDGGVGNDSMSGGAGDDTYVVDSTSDVITEAVGAAGGTDTVKIGFAGGYTMAANVEKLIMTGNSLTATGNVLDNTMTSLGGNNILNGGDGNDTLNGGTGNDTLNGGAGNDTLNGNTGTDSLVGGAGDDTYVLATAGDTITEAAGAAGGADTVKIGFAGGYTMAANVEKLIMTGNSLTATGNVLDNTMTAMGGNNTLYGGTGNDTLNGGAGNDTLDGGVGNDSMSGGAGDDTYVVDSTSDAITEASNEGTDTVQASISYTLGLNVENLVLTGAANLSGTGNELNNTITGGTGNDTLNGGAGNDTLDGGAGGTDSLVGGLGNDTYVLATAGDAVDEKEYQGVDTVNVGFSGYTIAVNVENLVLTGSTGLAATGNSGNNVMVGNSGNDTLTGGLGIDVLFGGAGDDTLTETNTDASNALFGGAGNDTLTSGVKADFLAGGAGSDIFTLGSGADVLAFNLGDGADTVNTVTGSSAVLSLGGGIKLSDLSLQKSGADLIVNTNAAKTEKLTLKNWYAVTPQTGIAKLQLMVDASADYLATSADKLKNKRIETFDFKSLVSSFNSSGTTVRNAWSLTNAALTAYLAGSDNAALGGELAYQYGKNNAGQLALGTAQTQLSSAFGSSTQSVTVGLTLSTGQMGLSG